MPRGAWTKRGERQYSAVLRSCLKKRGKAACKSMAAAVVNKRRALEGRAKTVGCHCPKGTRPLKSDRKRCYNPSTRKRVLRLCLKKRRR